MGTTQKISKQPAVYEFADLDLKILDNNQNGILDRGDQVQAKGGKRTFFVDNIKGSSKSIQALSHALFAKKDTALSGLRLGKAQDYLKYYKKAERIEKAIGDPNQAVDLGETLNRAEGAIDRAKFAAGLLFDRDQRPNVSAEMASLNQVTGLSVALHFDAKERAKSEGDVLVARQLGDSNPGILETRAKLLLDKLKRVADEQGTDAAKQQYEKDFSELKSLRASRDILKSFKKGFRLLAHEEKKASHPTTTPNLKKTVSSAIPADFSLAKESFKANLEIARGAGHQDKAVAACQNIKSIFSKDEMSSSSALAVKSARAEYKAIRQDFEAISQSWEFLKANYQKLSPSERELALPEMRALEISLLFYQQSMEGTELSARVAAKDHNAYFPGQKLSLPQELPNRITAAFPLATPVKPGKKGRAT